MKKKFKIFYPADHQDPELQKLVNIGDKKDIMNYRKHSHEHNQKN